MILMGYAYEASGQTSINLQNKKNVQSYLKVQQDLRPGYLTGQSPILLT